MIRQIKADKILWVLLIFFSIASLVACKGNSPKKATTHSAADSNLDTISGKVAETMNSGGYTYILVERKGGNTWVAVPEMQISKGDKVTLNAGTEMVNFHSNTLKRTFKEIIFSSGPVSNGKIGMEKAHKGLPIDMEETPVKVGGMGMITPMQKVKVKGATGPNAYTIAELYKKRNELNNKEVVVRGKVIKALPMIMNRNWIHLQDGSGSAKKRNYDLVVTSDDLPSVGDVVTFTGTLHADKDFGMGYKYRVIVENGSTKK
ncbi:MAG: DNA-binding protein [Nitrospiraceae bacterium]|nr:DNA-binding protein [Nitrospiraceae bacterium]